MVNKLADLALKAAQALQIMARNQTPYEAYISSAKWRVKRQAALEAAGHRCQVCNGQDDLEVHHRTYDHFGDELPGDVTVLCGRCHEIFHTFKRLPSLFIK